MNILDRSDLQKVFEICIPGKDNCLSQIKKINNLDIITLDELLDVYDSENRPPVNADEVHNLSTLISEKLGFNCIRYKENYETYKNVENSYIYLIILELLGIRYGIDINEYLLESSSDDEDSGEEESGEEESGEDGSGEEESDEEESGEDGSGEQENTIKKEQEIMAYIYYHLFNDITTIREEYKLLFKKQPGKKSKLNLLKKIATLKIETREKSENPCIDKTVVKYDIILAIDSNESNMYRNKTLSDKIIQDFSAHDRKILLESLQYKSILDRIHGMLIMKYGGCNIYASAYPPPKIIQLSVVCTSTYPYTDKKAIGSYLIGSFILISKIRNFDLIVLEVANDCVGGDDPNDDEADKYGDINYKLGKETQKKLYCLYERFGFREDSRFHEKYNCFSNDPFPSMVMDLRNKSLDCLSSIIINRALWTDEPSAFCKDGNYDTTKESISDLCS